MNRREALASGTAVLALAVPASTSPAPVDRSEWESAMAAFERAEAEDAAFNDVYWPIHEAWEAGRPSMEGIPWNEFPFMDRDHVARSIDLDRYWQQFLDGEGRWWWARDGEARKARYREALDAVQAYRDAEERHAGESGMVAADERWNDLGDTVSQAQGRLMDTPAPDLAALRWKLEHIIAEEGENGVPPWSSDYVAQTVADIARLMPPSA